MIVLTTLLVFYNLEDPNERGYDVIRRLFLLEIAKTKVQITQGGN